MTDLVQVVHFGAEAVAAGRAEATALVHDLSFTVADGEVLALVGESGSGKTTTGLALLGEARPGIRLHGTITVAGRDPRHRSTSGRPPVGYVPQQPGAALNPARRVTGLLAELARVSQPADLPRRQRRANAAARVVDAARAAALPPPDTLRRRFPHQLSGGQQQRAVLAGALLGRPRLLVLDEPTTGLDTLHRGRVLDELAQLRHRGLAVVLLTHDLPAVRELADHVLVLRHGTCCEAGPVAHVFDRPQHSYTRELLAAQPRLRPAATVGRQDRVPTAAPADAGPSLTPAPVSNPDSIRVAGPETGASSAGLVVTGLTASHRAPGGVRRLSAIQRIDLAVPAGGCLAVVGPSGGGKTTFARCLAGLHPPDTGTVTVAGEPLPPRLAQRTNAQRRRVQYVFQDPRASFVAERPVREQVARTAVRLRRLGRGSARAEATALLAALGVDDVTARRRPDQLSGGELQRAALARALLAEPDVLICDEVTAALDTFTQASVSALLAGLAARNDLALVVIGHDLALVERLADRVAVIAEGALVELGTTEQVLTDPGHRITRELRDAARR